ncbi:MAG: energy-coupling factor transporter transmembrane protein EcfT [Desulfovibrio sp.]
MQVSFVSDSPAAASFPGSLNVRTKLGLCVLCSLSAIVLSSPVALIPLLAASVVYALSTRNFKGMLMAYLGVSLMLGTSAVFVVLLSLIWPEIANMELRYFLVPFLRIVLMLNVVLGLALTSRIQPILTALKSLKLPGLLYIPASVMIRFIPTFLSDARQVLQALKIRGYPLNPVSLARHPLRGTRVLFVPLVFRALRSADDLAMAAELKGVGRSRTIVPHRAESFTGRDGLVLVLALALTATAFAIQARSGFSMGMH